MKGHPQRGETIEVPPIVGPSGKVVFEARTAVVLYQPGDRVFFNQPGWEKPIPSTITGLICSEETGHWSYAIRFDTLGGVPWLIRTPDPCLWAAAEERIGQLELFVAGGGA